MKLWAKYNCDSRQRQPLQRSQCGAIEISDCSVASPCWHVQGEASPPPSIWQHELLLSKCQPQPPRTNKEVCRSKTTICDIWTGSDWFRVCSTYSKCLLRWAFCVGCNKRKGASGGQSGSYCLLGEKQCSYTFLALRLALNSLSNPWFRKFHTESSLAATPLCPFCDKLHTALPQFPEWFWQAQLPIDMCVHSGPLQLL